MKKEQHGLTEDMVNIKIQESIDHYKIILLLIKKHTKSYIK